MKYLLLLFLILPTVTAVSCPFGLVMDAFPGQCGRYIDDNANSICDLSEQVKYDETVHQEVTGQEIKEMTVEEVAILYSMDPKDLVKSISAYVNAPVQTEDNIEDLHDEFELQASTVKVLAQTNARTPAPVKKYHMLQIALVSTLLYLFTYFMSKKKMISQLAHKQVWNLLLTITFMISAVLGILLVIRINYGWFEMPFNLLYWHVEAGLSMAVITIFHIIFYWRYFNTYIKWIK